MAAHLHELGDAREATAKSRQGFDNAWTLGAVLSAYCLINLLLQRGVWTTVTHYGRISLRREICLFAAPVVALLLCVRLAPQMIERSASIASDVYRSSARLLRNSLVLAAVSFPLLIAFFVLDRFPNSGDEYAYLFQAEQFARAHLWARAPPLADTFVAFRTWIIGDKWVSQYPPGWPLVLALAMLAGLPAWTINAALGAASVSAIVSRWWGRADGALKAAAVSLYVMTPFYLLNAASLYSHTWAALLILLLCLSCLRYQRDENTVALVACGALIGLLGATRYFSLVLLLPALAWWALVESRRHRLRIISAVALSAAPFLAGLLLYQYSITENPLRSTYSVITTDDVFLSFRLADIVKGTKLTVIRLAELGLWTCPLLLPAYLLCLAGKIRERSLAFYDLVFPCFVVGYVLFADLGGNRYGPRYYLDAFPLMLITMLSSTRAVDFEARRALRRWAAASLLVSAVYVACAVPLACNAFRQQVRQREQPYRLVANVGRDKAIVIIEKPSGQGLLATDLVRNDTRLEGRVLYARPDSSPAELHRWYPARSIWVYRGPQRGLERVVPPADPQEPTSARH